VNDSISNISKLKGQGTDTNDPHTDTQEGGGFDDSDDILRSRVLLIR